MSADKVRIKKYQIDKVQYWCKALEVPQTRFVEDAINCYIKFLGGNVQAPVVNTPITQTTSNTSVRTISDTIPTQFVDDDDDDFLDNFTGGLTLD